ncbi:MAG: glycosyltransferase family 87 protein [Eubacteriales bacterium]
MDEAAGTSRLASPYGVDFGVYYTAGKMVLSGESDRIFDIAVHHAALEEVLQRQLPFYLPWLYPPVFLLAIVPFCFVPFTAALVLWLLVTFLLALFALYKLLPKLKGLAVMSGGFLGFLMNLRWGQNGFLNTALIGFGLYFLEGNPILAGLMFGLLTYKPHIAAFPILILLLLKKWRVLKWTVIFAAVGVVVSGVLFGFDLWVQFFQSLFSSTSGLLGDNGMSLAPIQPSLYSTLRLAGFGDGASYALQAIIGTMAVFAVWRVWKTTDRMALRGSALVLGIFLMNPYFLQYDLMMLSIPLILFVYDFIEHGARPHEIVLLLLLWLMPLLDRNLVEKIGFHICPPLLALLLLMIFFRIKSGGRTKNTMTDLTPGR